MLKILDRDNKLKFILSDESEEPVEIDELILRDAKNKVVAEETNEEKDNRSERN